MVASGLQLLSSPARYGYFGKMLLTVALLSVLNALVALGQLSGRVGPTTPRSSKQQTICNVLNYGGSIGSNVGTSNSILLLEFNQSVGYWTGNSVRFQQLRPKKQRFYPSYTTG